MGTSRLESFSDGVIAVAITLLVLGITVPNPNAHPYHTLLYELAKRWPDYAAYVISFLTIGIIWINHHRMINRLRDADYTILILNLLLLMSIGILPFATQLMATYLREHNGQSLAAAVYGGAFLIMSLTFASLNWTILIKRAHLFEEQLTLEQRQLIQRRTLTGLVPYAIATALAFVSPYLTLAICAAVAVFYALPYASGP